jgi:hypothetical protein
MVELYDRTVSSRAKKSAEICRTILTFPSRIEVCPTLPMTSPAPGGTVVVGTGIASV